MDKLTPTHAQWRQRRATAHHETTYGKSVSASGSFLAGMKEEHEAARLIGWTNALHSVLPGIRKDIRKTVLEELARAEAQLAALLAKGEA